MSALTNILIKIALGLVSEQVIKKMIVVGLKYMVAKTETPVDDDLVKPIIEALEK